MAIMIRCQFQILIAHEHNGKKVPAQFCQDKARKIPIGLKMCRNHAEEFKQMEQNKPADAMLTIYRAIKRRRENGK